MGIFDRFPYSSTHEMNLDFMLGKAQEINQQLQTVQTGMQEVQTGLSQISEQTTRATTAAAAAEAARDESQQNERDAFAWTEQAEQHADRAEAALSQMTDDADRAEASAQNASNSATAASSSADIASQNSARAAQQAANAQLAAHSAQDALNQAIVAEHNAQTSATSAADAAALASGYNTQAATSATNAATSATNAAASATSVLGTEQNVQNLVESIPEDYTTLSNDVDGLKSALIYDERTLGLPVEIDNVYDSYSVPKGNGTFYNSSAEIWKATDYISTDGIDLIYYQGMSQGSGSSVIVPIAFYDVDKNFISAETNSTSGMHIQSGIAKVPSNAKYYKQSRYINPNDHDIQNSNNYTKYTYTDAEYPVPKTINDLYKRCILGYFFTGHLELDTVNRVLTVKTGTSDVILTENQKSIHTGISNNQTYTTPDANNYAILYKESTQTIVFMTGSANGVNTDDCVFLGCYAYGYIYNALGLIKVNGEVKNKTIESALANSSTQQIESIVSSINALSSNLTSEISTRQTADTALGERIDNLVAPSGDSIAEVTDARVGIGGTLYASLEARLNAEIGSLFGKIGNILTVGTNKDYQSIAAAVNASNAGDIILIDDGVYTENIVNRDKCIAIIGASKEGTIIQYPNNDYSRPPLEMAKGVLKNLTLHATEVQDTTAGAYALHCDFQGSGVIGGYMYCDNVKFINDNYRAVGLGTRGNSRIEFANCDFISYASSEALYMHDANDTAYDINNQYLSFRNCTFHNNSSTKHTIEAVSQERQIAVAHVEWQRNIVVNDSTGGTIAMSHYQSRDLGADNWMGSSDWVLDSTSALNTESIMNN